jgi:Mrp family chromosome partitioning ATPase
LAEYLTGDAEPTDVLRTVRPVREPSQNGASADDGGIDLACILAGAPSTGAAERLDSSRMRDLLDEVGSVYDLVVIDSAPLLPVADTLALLPLAGIVLMCVKSGRSTQDQVRAAKAVLELVTPDTTGVVVTDLRERDEPVGNWLYPYVYSYEKRS